MLAQGQHDGIRVSMRQYVSPSLSANREVEHGFGHELTLVHALSHLRPLRFLPCDIPDLCSLEAPNGLEEEAGFSVCFGIWLLVSASEVREDEPLC